MELIDCPECPKKISHKAERCPHCGYPGPFSKPPKPQKPKISAKKRKSALDEMRSTYREAVKAQRREMEIFGNTRPVHATQSSELFTTLFLFFVIIVLLWYIISSDGRELSDIQWFGGSWFTRATADCDYSDTTLRHACQNAASTAKQVVFLSGCGFAFSLSILIGMNRE